MKHYTGLILAGAALFCLMQGPALAQDEKSPSGGMEKPGGAMHAKMSERMKEVDTNGDGNISKAEYLAQAEKRFAKMDMNGDGVITPDEREAKRKEMQAKRQQAKAEREAKRAQREGEAATPKAPKAGEPAKSE